MNIEKFDITTTKLNVVNFPECNDKQFIVINMDSNLDILDPNENKQKIILTYNIKSNDYPLHIMWECRIILTFNGIVEQKISEKDFLEFSEVLDVIDKQIENISSLTNMDLPLFSDSIED